MFALVDANAFYCSAEQVFRPDWRGKPIIVLSNNDGCIVAANRQAKEAGIQKFLPYFQVKALCAERNVIVCSSNYELYADLSAKMMAIIGRFAPDQHVYSIDECFLSFKHSYPAIKCLYTHGQLIRRTVWKEARLPVCVGMGDTLTLAKIANHAAKKIPGYQGVCVIETLQQRTDILRQLAVGDVWGIGRRISKKLEVMNIRSAYDLACMPPSLARKQFSIEIERTVRELNGQVCKQWDEARADKKQIFSTRSVGELTKALRQAAPRLFRVGVRYYKIGVGLVDLASEKYFQFDLFNPAKVDYALMHTLDSINQRYGRDTVFLAAQGIQQKWAMRRDLLTPQYSTQWKCLPKIKC